MANTPLASIELLLADLTVIRDRNLATLSGPQTALTPSLIPPLAAFTHWAIQIRNKCYEVTSKTYEAVAERNQYELRISTAADWEARRRHYDLKFEKMKVGVTKLSDEDIVVQAHLIWLSRFNTGYDLTTQNCQNFARCLFEAVKVPVSEVSSAERSSWKHFPARLTNVTSGLKKAAPLLLMGGLAAIALPIIANKLEKKKDENGYRGLMGPKRDACVAVGAACAVLAPLALQNSKDKRWRGNLATAEKMMGTTVRAVTASVMNGSTVSLSTTSQSATSTTTVETGEITQDHVIQNTSTTVATPPPPYVAQGTQEDSPRTTLQPTSEIVQLFEKLSDPEKMTILQILKGTESGMKKDESTLQTESSTGAACFDSNNTASLTQIATTAQVGSTAATMRSNMKASPKRKGLRVQRRDSTEVSLKFNEWSTSLNASSTTDGTPLLSLKIDEHTPNSESGSTTTATASLLSSIQHKCMHTTHQSSTYSFLAATTAPGVRRIHRPVPITAGLLKPSYLGTAYFNALGTGTVEPHSKCLELPMAAQEFTNQIM